MTAISRRISIFTGVMAAVVVALLPWWRNRHYLRDLFDYGLVLAANGRLELGEKPYVDFTTPIQAGFLGLNWLIEKAGRGTYAALTMGGAGLIVVTALLLIPMLMRRWPWWAALIVGFAVTAAGAAQHTILWHNSLGILCLALATWAGACAPVLRRSSWPWHLFAAAGLFLGGINKLNFQLVAVVVSLAWAGRAVVGREAGWCRGLVTGGWIFMMGVVCPVACELAWTGASLSLWLDNVVRLAVGSRSDHLWQIWSVDFLLQPIHDYYGPLLLPQVGLAGVILSLGALAGCWPARAALATRPWDRWLVPVAVMMAGLAGAALLATNFEIAYLGLGAWLVLVTSVWLGFAQAGGRRIWFVGGLIVPALMLGTVAWWTAWLGQRSQFGFSPAARQDYLPAETAGPAFAGLSGLRLPPEVILSFEVLDAMLPEAGPDGHRPVFYGSGLELIHRYYPGLVWRGQPLWFHGGTTYGPAEIARLREELARPGRYQAFVSTLAFDEWPEPLREVLHQYYFKDLIGPVVRHWVRHSEDTVNLSDSIETVTRLGGNVDGRVLLLHLRPLGPKPASDGRILLGTTRRAGQVLLHVPTYRLSGSAVVDRQPGAGAGPLAADFKIIVHGASPEDVRWSARVELPAGQQSVSVPFTADGSGKELLLWVTRPAGEPDGLLAGFRDLEITHAVDLSGPAPRLQDESMPESPITPRLAESLFGDTGWRPQQLVTRGGRPAAHGLELPAWGELWLHTPGMTGEIHGWLEAVEHTGRPTLVRILWYKGGRLQILQHAWVQPGQPVEYRAWTAEPGGWIGLMVERGDDASSVLVQVAGSTLTP